MYLRYNESERSRLLYSSFDSGSVPFTANTFVVFVFAVCPGLASQRNDRVLHSTANERFAVNPEAESRCHTASARTRLPLFLELSGGGGASRPRKVVHYLQLCHRDYRRHGLWSLLNSRWGPVVPIRTSPIMRI